MRKSIYSRGYQALCDRLIAERNSAGLTQEALARRLKRPQSFVAKYEGGERRLDIIELLEIADHLDADVFRILKYIKASIGE